LWRCGCGSRSRGSRSGGYPEQAVAPGGYPAYRRIEAALVSARASRRLFDYETRPMLHRQLTALLADRHGIDMARDPEAARAALGDDLWPLLDPGRPPSGNSAEQGIPAPTLARIQFTPDLLPADVTGSGVYDQRSAEIVFRPGPVFTNLLLADEINRTPPKAQAALLEAMAEQQVTVDGRTHALPRPFIVLATDNPIEYEGTYPLPEAQLDRFLLRTRLGYLPPEDETVMLRTRLGEPPEPARLRAVTDAAGLIEMRGSLRQVHVGDDVLGYVVRLLTATRGHAKVTVGASPRSGIAATDLARGQALLDGRDYVTPEDVKAVAVPVLAHRLVLRPELWVRRVTGEDIVAELLDEVPTPGTGERQFFKIAESVLEAGGMVSFVSPDLDRIPRMCCRLARCW
jgi:MoxR-like ATPase